MNQVPNNNVNVPSTDGVFAGILTGHALLVYKVFIPALQVFFELNVLFNDTITVSIIGSEYKLNLKPSTVLN